MRSLVFALSALAMLTLAGGCEVSGTTGEQGNLEFYDKTETPAVIELDQQIDKPLAVGATLALQVKKVDTKSGLVQKSQAVDVSVSSVTSEDEAVLSVAGQGNPFTVEGVAVGKARINVMTADDLEDSIVVTVSEPDASELTTYFMESPFPLNPSLYPAGVFLEKGEAVMVWSLLKSGATALTGSGAAQYAMDVAEVLDKTTHNNSDTLTLQGATPGTTTLSDGFDGSLTIEVVDSTHTLEVAELKAWRGLLGIEQQADTTFATVEDQSISLFILRYVADGKLVMGFDDEQPVVVVEDETIVSHQEGQTANPDDESLSELMGKSGFITFNAMSQGTTTATITWFGQEIVVTINVEPDLDGQDG